MSDIWTNMDACLALLEPFEEATRALPSEKYATISLYYAAFRHLLDKINNHSEYGCREAADGMRQELLVLWSE